MGETGDKLLSESKGKTIAVYYNDTHNSVSFKVGKFLDFDENNLKLLDSDKDEAVLLPRVKCIRIEINGKTKHFSALGKKEPKNKPLAKPIKAGGKSK